MSWWTSMSERRRAVAAIAASVLLAGLSVAALPGTPASASEPINGGGSTWSAVAIAAWQADVAREGLTVNYQATGSTAGRQGYTAGTYDFAVSEIPFQPQYCTNPADPSTCYDEQTQPGLLGRPYAYMPIVAGGHVLRSGARHGRAAQADRLDVGAGVSTPSLPTSTSMDRSFVSPCSDSYLNAVTQRGTLLVAPRRSRWSRSLSLMTRPSVS